MAIIINLTQHASTPEQKAAGVFDLQGQELVTLKELLTFVDLPSKEEIQKRAKAISELAYKAAECPACSHIGDHCGDNCNGTSNWFWCSAMVGGAGYLLPALVDELKIRGFEVLQSFTKREVVETVSPDGSVVKTAVFRHVGFVEC